MKLSFTPEQLKSNHSGTYLSELRKNDYHAYPVMKFGNYEYIIVSAPNIKPGRNRAEVINLTEFNAANENDIADGRTESYFQIARDGRGDAFLSIDEGIGLLVITPDGKFYEYTNPSTAVLTYRIEPATRADLEQTRDEMDDEMTGGW